MIQFDDLRKMKQDKTCAITGMRPHKLPFREGDAQYHRIMQSMEGEISIAITNGYTTFISGGSIGPDLWFAETVHRLKFTHPRIRLEFIILCETQANRWPECWRERYFNILAASDGVAYISRAYTPSCMHERNRTLVDRSSLLFAVYDGVSTGGTKYTVNYAKRCGIEIINLFCR